MSDSIRALVHYHTCQVDALWVSVLELLSCHHIWVSATTLRPSWDLLFTGVRNLTRDCSEPRAPFRRVPQSCSWLSPENSATKKRKTVFSQIWVLTGSSVRPVPGVVEPSRDHCWTRRLELTTSTTFAATGGQTSCTSQNAENEKNLRNTTNTTVPSRPRFSVWWTHSHSFTLGNHFVEEHG